GRVRSVRGRALGLLRDGLRRRDAMRVDAALEQLMPPASVVLAGGGSLAILGAIAGAPLAAALAAYAAVGIAVHVMSGLAAVKAPFRTYVAVLRAGPYVLWKVGIYARALFTPRAASWVRTGRVTASTDPPTTST